MDVTEGGTSTERTLEPQHREMLEKFSRRLRDAREAKFPKLTQERACREIGVSLRQYQRWEHGEQFPPFERIQKIVEIVGVDVSDLFEPQGSMTRDGMKEYFDMRINAVETLVQANQALIQEAIEELDTLNHTILDAVERIEKYVAESELE